MKLLVLLVTKLPLSLKPIITTLFNPVLFPTLRLTSLKVASTGVPVKLFLLLLLALNAPVDTLWLPMSPSLKVVLIPSLLLSVWLVPPTVLPALLPTELNVLLVPLVTTLAILNVFRFPSVVPPSTLLVPMVVLALTANTVTDQSTTLSVPNAEVPIPVMLIMDLNGSTAPELNAPAVPVTILPDLLLPPLFFLSSLFHY